MSYEDDGLVEEQGFRVSDEDEETMEPLEEIEDFGFDEEDPDKDH